MTVVAVVVVAVDIARIEVQVVSVVGVRRIERTGPVVAVGTCVVERTIVAIPRSGKECFATAVT